MSDILLINSDGLTSPSVNLRLPKQLDGNNSFGWGIGWYPDNKQAAMVLKDPVAGNDAITIDLLTDWSNFCSTVFMYSMKTAQEGYTNHETQPFSRSFAGKDWLFVLDGNIDKAGLEKLHTDTSTFLEPLGKTEAELAFCYLLSKTQKIGARKISHIKQNTLLSWLEEIDKIGNINVMMTDGISTLCFHGTQSARKLQYARFIPPNTNVELDSPSAHLELNNSKDQYRTTLMVTSAEFSSGDWTSMQPGQLIITRNGAITFNNKPMKVQQPATTLTPSMEQTPAQDQQATASVQPENDWNKIITSTRSITNTSDGTELYYRLFDVTHTTEYKYTQAVEHSTHKFRMKLVEDHIQEVVHGEIFISVKGESIQYEDVFGNHSVRYNINTPYTNLVIQSKSQVKIFARPPDEDAYPHLKREMTIPLIWMPWQRQMMVPFLLPMELPDAQLEELTTYAMSFVERNDYQLLPTLEDMNLSIYQDYQYIPGSTSLQTTPFEVYVSRSGVCQDFANLFICLARLLGLPARYRMGYIYTGANYKNKIQSEGSHAWVEIYLPFFGWRGFDPTNGCIVNQDHIRVASGRHYRDATPTSGTIFKGGQGETLNVDVKIKEIFAK